MSIWSSSVNQTQSPKKRKFVAEAVSYAKLNERPLERAAAVMARSSQKQSVSRVFLRRMRNLTEDGHAGIAVRATSNCTETIICATQTHDVLDEKGRKCTREPASIVQRRFAFT